MPCARKGIERERRKIEASPQHWIESRSGAADRNRNRVALESRYASERPRSFPPNTELSQFDRPQMRLVRTEELVQLRRLYRCAGKHCMRLSTMMDLMLEQMREQSRDRFCLNSRTTHYRHRPIEILLGKHCARGDQPSIGVA